MSTDKFKHLMKVYAPQNVCFVKGEGAWLWDKNNKKYLDFLSGISVMNLGHSNPEITEVIKNQSEKLMHVSNGFIIDEQVELANKLCKLTGLDQAFFCSTGAEANEASVKLARLYGHQMGYKNPVIICMHKGFHGRTMANISASSNPKLKEGFDPMLPGFAYCDFNNVESLKKCIADCKANGEQVVGVWFEPIQGEGGVNVPADNYLSCVRKICDKNKILMILDEVQSGAGRTGELFAFQHEKILPDIVSTAKGIGNGYPVAACLAKESVAKLFTLGKHGTTFGGSPMACAVANKVVDIMSKDGFYDHVREVSSYFLKSLKSRLGKYKCIKDIRGKGLLIGIEFDQEVTFLRKAGMDVGIVFSVTQQKIVRIAPPLIITEKQCDQFVERFDGIVKEKVNNERSAVCQNS